MNIVKDDIEEYKIISSSSYKNFSEQVTALLTCGKNWKLLGDPKVTSPSMVFDKKVERTVGREVSWNQALVRLKYPLRDNE
jgi:hypothetical protein